MTVGYFPPGPRGEGITSLCLQKANCPQIKVAAFPNSIPSIHSHISVSPPTADGVKTNGGERRRGGAGVG